MKKSILIATLLAFLAGMMFSASSFAGQGKKAVTGSTVVKGDPWEETAKAARPKPFVFSIADLILNWLGIGQNGSQPLWDCCKMRIVVDYG